MKSRLILVVLTALALSLSTNYFLPTTILAQAPSCIQQPGETARVEGGLISATDRAAGDKFGSSEGVCAISNRASFTPPTYADLKSKFYDQAKTTSSDAALSSLNSENLIRNASFETKGSSEETLANWTISGTGSRSADRGANTGCFTAKTQGPSDISQTVSVSPGVTYTLSGSIFTTDPAAKIEAVGGCSASTPQTNAWKQINCSFIPTSSSVTVRLSTSSSASTAWYDDISLVSGGTAAVASGTVVKYPAASGSVDQEYFNAGGAGSIRSNGVYQIKGDLTLSGPITAPPKSVVIFVDGKVNINSDFTYGNSSSGVVIVSNQDMNINADVRQVDAILVTYGQFCSAYKGSACDTSDKQLVINGSVITLNPAIPPTFSRALQDNSQAAEKFNFQAKYYGLLTNMFTDTVKIYSEIADPNFSFPTSTFTNPSAGSSGSGDTGSSTLNTSYPTNNKDLACSPACQQNSSGDWVVKSYFDGLSCGAKACPMPDPPDCSSLNNTCHGSVTLGGTAATCGAQVVCPSNLATYTSTQGSAAVCGDSNMNACNTDGTRKTYYTGTLTGSTCNQASCAFPYSPTGQRAQICGTRTTDAAGRNHDSSGCFNPTTLNTYYNGASCTKDSCFVPVALDCAALDAAGCHDAVTGYNGFSCDPTAITCRANYTYYPGADSATQLAACGNNNTSACNADGSLKKFSNGSSCSLSGTCGYPYAGTGNQTAVCGTNNATACANSTTLNKYYTGSSCTQANCGFPPAINCATLDANGCHDTVKGYDGVSCNPQAKTCPANFTSYSGYSSSTQTAVCGSSNINACNADGSLKKYSDGSSCSANATCGYPYASAGNHDSVCGATFTGTVDGSSGSWDTASACSGTTTLNQFWRGNSCTKANCFLPKPLDCSVYTSLCHDNIYGYSGISCDPTAKVCPSNATTYQTTYSQINVCGTNNATACNGTSDPNITTVASVGGARRQYYGSACSKTTCGYPLSTQVAQCGADNSDACTGPNGTRKTFYNGGSCSADGVCGDHPATDCTPYNNSCHGDIGGWTGVGCNYSNNKCPSNVTTYTSSYGSAAVCGAGNVNSCLTSTDSNITMDTSVTPNRRQYFTGATSGTTCTKATCNFPTSTQTAVCGAAVDASHDANGCNLDGSGHGNGTYKQFYPGNACTKTNCKPPAATSYDASCHADVYGYNGSDCQWRLISGANYKPVSDCSATPDGCTSPAGGSQSYYTGANSCTTNNVACPLADTSSRCPTDGCTSTAGGGSQVTYHSASACNAVGCTIRSTVGRCDAGCTYSPTTFHVDGSCGPTTCDNHYYPANTYYSCRTAAGAYQYNAPNSCGQWLAGNCSSWCMGGPSTAQGTYCYNWSQGYVGDDPTTGDQHYMRFWWLDYGYNPDSGAWTSIASAPWVSWVDIAGSIDNCGDGYIRDNALHINFYNNTGGRNIGHTYQSPEGGSHHGSWYGGGNNDNCWLNNDDLTDWIDTAPIGSQVIFVAN